jgi:nicotinate-nucleotide adenylyltransferase
VKTSSTPARVGIYAGTFNPVHAGHIAFALMALEQARLDAIYFLPERRPRHKQHVEHYGHRVAMIRQALRPHPKLEVLETDDVSFTVRRTHRRLRQEFDGAQLVYLMGSDVMRGLHTWEHADALLHGTELVIGLRSGDSMASVRSALATLPVAYNAVQFISSMAADVSSTDVRIGLGERRQVSGLLASVARYSNRNWLYVSVR